MAKIGQAHIRSGPHARGCLMGVYTGALTYIGNAPNFMVNAIAEERGVKMPSFFGYMLWSGVVLLPVPAIIIYVSVWRP